jgi:hypothetical protein
MISLMKVGQLWGHSCLRTDTKTRLSLFKRVRSAGAAASLLDSVMMKLTTKLRIPMYVSNLFVVES